MPGFAPLEHLPALQVVIPLLAAPLCVFVPGPRAPWALAAAASFASLAIAVLLLLRVLDGGTISYALGGWAPPWGIEYRVDEVNAWLLLIVAGVSSTSLLYARESVTAEIGNAQSDLFYTGWLLCLAGMLGIAATGDAFNVFVFLEIASLSSYMLVSFGTHRRAFVAALRYLVTGTVGATFILIGIGFLYMMTGTLNMADLAERIPAVADTRAVRVAFAFIAIGVALKMALFPFHTWLPGAYASAPAAVTVFLSGTATKVAVYVLLRFFFTVFGAEFSFGTMHLDVVLLPLSLAAIVFASVAALRQPELKRLLAWSSLAQIGYMVLGIAIGTVAGLTGSIVHLFNHALMKTTLFMAAGCVVIRLGRADVDSLAGLGRRMPWTMGAFVAGGLSLIGVPFTAGFISKWYLLYAALERGWWPVAVVVVAASLIAFAYVWRVVECAYFREPAPESLQAHAREAPASLLVPMWGLVAANVYFGVDASLTVGVAERAARSLLGAGP